MIPLKDDNPTNTLPVVTIGLIVVNALVYIFQLSLPQRSEFFFFHRFGAIPIALTHFTDPFPGDGLPLPATLITSLFIHGGFFHLAGNMLFLWIFGNNIEDRLGHAKFLLFYLICGVTATLVHSLTDPVSAVPLVGASGAISGVMGAYMVLYPHARVLTFFLLVFYPVFIWVPAVLFLAFWLLIQFVSAGGAMESGVAWFAHIGGFLCGIVSIVIFIGKRPGPPKYKSSVEPYRARYH